MSHIDVSKRVGDSGPRRMISPLLEVTNLQVAFGASPSRRLVVKGLSLEVREGQCLAIVGESGSGKSVTARALVGLAGNHSHVRADCLRFAGRELSGLKDREWRHLRGQHIGFVLQDALVSLDPLRPVGKEIEEALAAHGAKGGTGSDLVRRTHELLRLVGVPEPEIKAKQLPGQLSGGQRQRALIATAIALDPTLLIADEPTTALDATVQVQILELLTQTRARGKAMILISHDLAVVSQMADEVLVMFEGAVVERGPVDQIFSRPQHPYTQRLLAAIPSARPGDEIRALPRRCSAEALPPQAPEFTTVHLGTSRPADPLPPLLEARSVSKHFRGPDGKQRTAVKNASFSLAEGETLGIVGESGSGKSTLARMALALEQPDEGEVLLKGLPWTAVGESERRRRRSNISVVYQDPLSSFDPRWSVRQIIADALPRDGNAHRALAGDRGESVQELLSLVGLSSQHLDRRPLELSGGQRQRVAIARAIAPRPRVVVCDEPVSALDVSIQAQILVLLTDLQARLGMSYLFISHDLAVVHQLSHRVLVMHRGDIVEAGSADEIFLRPQQPYTKTLVAAMPRLRSFAVSRG